MVKCPQGTPSQIAANLAAFNKQTTSKTSSKDAHFIWGQDAATESMLFFGEGNNEVMEGEREEVNKEEPELDCVLADKRSPPTTEDEIVHLFVYHFMDVLTESWDGEPCLKPKATEEVKSAMSFYADDTELFGEDVFYERPPSPPPMEFFKEMYKSRSQKLGKSKHLSQRSKSSMASNKAFRAKSSGTSQMTNRDSEELAEPEVTWKSFVPDEEVHVLLTNGAWYRGRVSRKLMEGHGVYFWEDGSLFKGEFIGGNAMGLGRLTFSDQSVYEGTVYKAFRHGEGLQCMYGSPVMYSGEWWLGKKHGHGLIVYNEPSKGLNFYNGHWEYGLQEGFGYRQYASGAKYIGYWKKGKRHGRGVMLWSNHDTYRGEWKDGLMHGYGEYTWNGFINKTFSYPSGNTHKGYWTLGKRNGHGVFETFNDAIIETVWKDDMKEGGGAVVCSDGSVVSSERLFSNDKPALLNDEEDQTGLLLRNRKEKAFGKNKKRSGANESHLLAYLSSIGRAKAVSIPIHAPTHSIDLTPHMISLTAKKKEVFPEGSIKTSGNGKVDSTNSAQSADTLLDYDQSSEYHQEEKLLRHAIMININKLRARYDKYAAIACEEKPAFKCVLLRIFLWQLLIDCGVRRKHMSLVEIDEIIARESYLLIENSYDPFEKIQFWQFIHILIKLSWLFYGQHLFGCGYDNDHIRDFLQFYNKQDEKFVLSQAFKYFLTSDILNEKEANEEQSIRKFKDLAPMEAMYLVYREVGEPHTAREFLNKVCVGRNRRPAIPDLVRYFEKLPSYKIEGKNAATMAGELTFLHEDQPFNHPKVFPMEKETEDSFVKSQLICFNELKPKGVIKCLAQVCPGIAVDGLIVNMEYKLTFLEFFQTVVKCTEYALKKKAIKAVRSEVIRIYKAEREEYNRVLEEYEKQKLAAVRKPSAMASAAKKEKK